MRHATSDRAARSAIPTRYRKIQFRSRLEATWAAFFDECRWEWEYEPLDLDGWIPDFLIRGHTPILVEVKPITKQDEELQASIDRVLGEDSEFTPLILGVGPFSWQIISHIKCIGWARGRIPEFDRAKGAKDDLVWKASVPAYWEEGKIGTCGAYSCDDLITGIRSVGPLGEKNVDVDDLWAWAKNATQWRRPCSR